MRYLLDTCVISDFIKGEVGTQARIKQTPPADIAISVITLMELRYGLQLNPQRAQKIEPVMASFLSSVTMLSFDVSESEKAAEIRAMLKTQGRPIGAYDVLIAATALQHQLIMVTANQREFVRVPGLATENWRQTWICMKILIGTILAVTQAEASSVIQIRGQDVLPATMGNRVIDALQQFESMLEQGALITINFNRAKVRVLPIGKPDSLN